MPLLLYIDWHGVAWQDLVRIEKKGLSSGAFPQLVGLFSGFSHELHVFSHTRPSEGKFAVRDFVSRPARKG
jgi:hypothetical protein